jgi:integrase
MKPATIKEQRQTAIADAVAKPPSKRTPTEQELVRLDAPTVARLTREATANTAPPDVIVFDGELAGFGLRLRRGAGGRVRASYVAQYRSHGRTRRMKIGQVEKLKPDEARKAARRILAKVELGGDPQGERAAARLRAGHTLHAIATEYLDARASALRPASLRVTKLYLLGHAYFGALHGVAAADVTLAEVAKRLTVITKNSGSVTAGRARAALSAMFKWAMGQGLVPANPVAGTNRPTDSTPRDRVLDDAEVAAIWRACADDDFGRVVKLLILTGCRRGEIGALRWGEVDFAKRLLVLPAGRTKNKHAHVLPLSDAALAIIKSAPRVLGRDHVFGGGRSGAGFTNWSTALSALNERLGGQVAEWRIHDLRRTCATKMADDLQIWPHVVEAVLNHWGGASRAGVAGVYNRAKYQDEMRKALDAWAQRVEEIVERPRLLKSL